jgi:hypothetical protein
MSDSLHKRTPLARVLAWLGVLCRVLFVFLPVVLMWWLAKDYRTNTLFLDDWAYVPLYEKAVHGGLTLHDFFAGYLEHRPAIARVIAIVTTLLSKGDVRWQCIVTFITITLTWMNCGLLLRRALGDWRRIWLPWGVMAWVLYCPVQWQEFLWPSCHMDTLPLLFLTTSLLVLGRERMNWGMRLALCVVCAWTATYSFAAGLTLWVLIPVAVACGHGFENTADRRRFILAWAVPAAVVLFCYFHGLKNEEDAPFAYGQGNEDTMTHSVWSVLKSPEKGIKFTVTLLGANLSRGVFGLRWNVAFGLGCGLCAVFLVGLVRFVGDWKRLANRRAVLPFVMVATYGFCVAGMVAAGRAWASKDVGGALNNRYACFSTAFVVGLVGLLTVLACRASNEREDASLEATDGDGKSRDFRRVTLAVGGMLCGLLVGNWFYGAQMMEAWHYARLRGAVDVHFTPLLGQAQDRGQPAQHIRLAHDRAEVMNRLGFLDHPQATSLNLDQFTIRPKLEDKLGWIISTDRVPESITIHGFALLTMHGRPPDAVLITWRNDAAGGERQIVQVVMPDNLPAFFLTDTMKDMQYVVLDDYRPKRFGEWSATVKRNDLPKNAKLRIEAWTLNFENFSVHEIGDGFSISN